MNYQDDLKKLLSLEYNCSETDIDSGANIITSSSGRSGRKYRESDGFFSMASTGKGCLVTADERLLPFVRELSKDCDGISLFEFEKLNAIAQELSRYGYELNGAGPHHMFLPCEVPALSQKFPLKRLEFPEFKQYYGDKRFPDILCDEYTDERPDVLVLAAMDGDVIMGMAGASRDFSGTPNWLQIGVDVLPEYRGKGIGSFLVNEITKLIQQSGDIPFYGTSPANIASQNTALKCGYRPAWTEISAVKKQPPAEPEKFSEHETWVDEMKQELEDYIEEQGIYIRQ